MPNYISLFSSAGVGCYGFKQAGFDCIATVEINDKRMQIQKNNSICKKEIGYITKDIQLSSTHDQLQYVINDYFNGNPPNIDVIFATPPCQGISIANHKKQDETNRNSLVIQSIKIINQYEPNFFIIENVKSFASTICTDESGINKPILNAIVEQLSENYHIECQELNLKNYGANSSRTRTIIIGTKRHLKNICPLLLYPDYIPEKALYEIIGHLPALNNMGDFSKNDYWHSFRPYDIKMLDWIKATPYGESAFNNVGIAHQPHKLINGIRVVNQNKNSNKYQRQVWDKVAPCIHTRNDCLASQNTIHPSDDRVFSIRELMLMMGIPSSFQWLNNDQNNIIKAGNLNEKIQLRKHTEKLIRECIGEAVPTNTMYKIATKIKNYLDYKPLSITQINNLIKKQNLFDITNLINFIKTDQSHSLPDIFKICELANNNRVSNAAYHTPIAIAYATLEYLPPSNKFKSYLKILEPSIGSGIFVFLLAKKYQNKTIIIDGIDIDENALAITQAIFERLKLPNIKLNLIHSDFLTNQNLNKNYDIAIMNPPFGKPDAKNLKLYKNLNYQNPTNLFPCFIEKCLKISTYMAMILPKSFLNEPKYQNIREKIANSKIIYINDFSDKAFNVKIETISLILNSKKQPDSNNPITIYSFLKKQQFNQNQFYITHTNFDTWLLYRNMKFEEIAKTLKFGIFNVLRDRTLTANNTKEKGEIQVIKARNIQKNGLLNIKGYDRYISEKETKKLAVGKYLNNDKIVLVPNLTYNIRAIFLPKNAITDGSVAMLIPNQTILKKDLDYFNSSEFIEFYGIARNYGRRGLNIDKISVIFFGIKK